MYHSARVLSATDDVTVCALTWSDEERSALESHTGFRGLAVPHRISKWRALAGSLATGLPTPVTRFRSAEQHARLRALLDREHFDLIWCHFLATAQNIPDTAIPILLDQHNHDAGHWQRIADGTDSPAWRAVGRWNARAWRRREARALARFRWILSVSETERAETAKLVDEKAAVWTAPNGASEAGTGGQRSDRPVVLFCGAMHLAMNDEGARWFMREVVPRVRREIPQCEFVLVGGTPTLRARVAARRANVRITGLVDDVSPFYRDASVAVVPVRMGGGTKIKTLEAMAHALPVVSTHAGVQGLRVVPDMHAVVTDDATRFAAAIIRLLQDPATAERLGAAARELIRAHYAWDDIYGSVRQRLGSALTTGTQASFRPREHPTARRAPAGTR